MENTSEKIVEASKSSTDKKYRLQAAFLGTVASISALIGFSKTLASAKKDEHKLIEKGGVEAVKLLEGGTALASRALAWGTLYAFLGVGTFCFGVWKLSGAKNFEEFRYKVGAGLPRLTKEGPPTSRTEFEGLTDLMLYLEKWGK
ncbi:transmembrane protein 242 isoform X2 [Condylostylus longicornis]|uniref:transmembrane protein 242 isoform X2 n=1 Tax=Condylostylus longicornis TaxID=2530218 RepID=UPI00244DF72E|nr:transmembrane protein 242 isoform X2 [Condylostylus longicornis]